MTISKHLESAIDILYRAGQDDNEKARAERRIAKALAAEAALPDLLAIVKAELDSGRNFGGDGDLYAAARAAIAKAEGGAS